MDEIQYAIKGKVDDWRYDRRNTLNIMLSSGNYKIPPQLSDMPLPYDDELESEIQDLQDTYNQAMQSGYFDNPIRFN